MKIEEKAKYSVEKESDKEATETATSETERRPKEGNRRRWPEER